MRLWQLSISRQALYVLFSRLNHFSSCQGENENIWGWRGNTNPSHHVSTQPRPFVYRYVGGGVGIHVDMRVTVSHKIQICVWNMMVLHLKWTWWFWRCRYSRSRATCVDMSGGWVGLKITAWDHRSSSTTRPHNWYIRLSPWAVAAAEKPPAGGRPACWHVQTFTISARLKMPDQYSITEGDFFSLFSPLLLLGAERPARTWAAGGLANRPRSWNGWLMRSGRSRP